MHRLIIATLLLIPLAARADEPADAAPAVAAVAAEIAVVETWDDLQKRPAIELENGPSVRVGIESHAIRQSGGVLVYLLVDGDEWARGGADSRGLLGPLRIEVETEHKREKLKELQQVMRQVRNAEWAGAEQLLFVATVPYEPGGALTVKLMHGEKTVVATTKLQPADEPTQPWYAFRNADTDRGHLNINNEMVAEVAPEFSRPVVPEFDGDRPFDWTRKDEDVDPDRPLPRLIPTEGPALTMTVKRKREQHELIVKFPEQILNGNITINLAARWWVDGEPVTSPRLQELLDQMQHAQRFVRGDTLRLMLNVPDGSFGDFGGERVEVELMYCPDGVADSGNRQRMMQVDQMFVHGQKQRQRAPMRSNRVQFQMPHKFAIAD